MGYLFIMNLRLCFYRLSRFECKFKGNRLVLKFNTMSIKFKRGALLVFEGLDRSGKSTQSRLLVESLKKMGKDAELFVFPDRTTPIGKVISEYLSDKSYDLNDKALHLLFTANRFENIKRMKKLLISGINVIVDRYCFSGIAFSSAKKGMDSDWCRYPESGLIVPDRVFFLTLSTDEMRKRPGFGEERYESTSFQTKVLEQYEKLAEEFNFTNINAKENIENIQSTILNYSLKTIENVENTDLQFLNFIEKHKEPSARKILM